MFTNPIDITARRKTDELLGGSYKVVKEVRDNLATIKAIYLEKDKITSYAESLQVLKQALENKKDGLFIGHDMGTVGEEDVEVTFTGDNPISALTRNLDAIENIKKDHRRASDDYYTKKIEVAKSRFNKCKKEVEDLLDELS